MSMSVQAIVLSVRSHHEMAIVAIKKNKLQFFLSPKDRRAYNRLNHQPLWVKNMIMTVCFLVLALLAPFSSLISSETSSTNTSQSAQQSLQETLSVKINEVIAHSKEIPGFTEVEFSGLRDSIQNAWNALSQKGVVEISGNVILKILT